MQHNNNNKRKDNYNMILLIEAEKALDKIQYIFLIKNKTR